MRITFVCESCRSELTVASHFAGRAILCPRCRQKTRIPATSAVSETPSSGEAEPLSPGSTARESANAFVKFCADFAPNPFAFSVRLDAFASSDGDAEDAALGAETSASKTPSVNELIATLLDEENR